ncbi:hypothetical protein [Streptomyces sp. Ag109_O5-1]|nr:hypothetical protein [Streptomyces sp. Ag109_O5-1]
MALFSATLAEVADVLDAHTVLPFPVPHDFTDGFQIALLASPAVLP